MQNTGHSFREVVTALFSQPDEILLEVGADGELLAARLRAVLAALMLLLPLANALGGGSITDTLTGLGAAVLANVFAQVWLALARRRRRFRWLPFVTAAFDVTAASAVLIMLANDQLPAGLNSLIVWCAYLLAILLTALRSDGRVTLFAGALALLQYGLLICGLISMASSPEELISSDYGLVTVGNQVLRWLLLAVIIFVTVLLVYRMQQLVEMSGTDGLTQLPNRTWLLHRVPRLFDAVRADGGTLTLALIDLDHFKRVNAEVGHHPGDRA
ncbi:MAG: GGDEF domain-containing protein, partial [Lysobacter sp.]